MESFAPGLVGPMPTLKVLPDVETNPEKTPLCQKAGFLSLKHLQRAIAASPEYSYEGRGEK